MTKVILVGQYYICDGEKHLRRIRDKFGVLLTDKKIVNLDIPDDYQYMDQELIEILQNRAIEIIEE